MAIFEDPYVRAGVTASPDRRVHFDVKLFLLPSDKLMTQFQFQSQPRRSVAVLATLSLVFLSMRPASAQEAADQEPSSDLTWQDLVDGMRFERQKLKSGIYVATGMEFP